MASKRLSDITQATSAPGLGDFLVGVTATNQDQLFPASDIGGNKPSATASITYYVATTGSDSNPGTLASPFATIQHALNVAASFDYLGLYIPTVQVEDGTYDVSTNHPTAELPVITRSLDPAKLFGNVTTPANVILTNSGSDTLIACGAGASWHIDGFRLDPIGFTPSMSCTQGSVLEFDDIEFANSAGDGHFTCMACTDYSAMTWDGNYMAVIPSAANRFANINTYSSIDLSFGLAFNFPAALAIGQQFVAIQQYSTFRLRGNSYTNFAGVTGNRVFAVQGAILLTDNGLVTDIPGNATGTIDATIEWLSNSSSFADFFANEKSGLPTTSDLSPGFYGVYKDTSGGGVYLAYNDAGTIKKVALV